jgi:hypothetical protein
VVEHRTCTCAEAALIFVDESAAITHRGYFFLQKSPALTAERKFGKTGGSPLPSQRNNAGNRWTL